MAWGATTSVKRETQNVFRVQCCAFRVSLRRHGLFGGIPVASRYVAVLKEWAHGPGQPTKRFPLVFNPLSKRTAHDPMIRQQRRDLLSCVGFEPAVGVKE